MMLFHIPVPSTLSAYDWGLQSPPKRIVFVGSIVPLPFPEGDSAWATCFASPEKLFATFNDVPFAGNFGPEYGSPIIWVF